MSDGIKLDFKVHFTTGLHGKRTLHAGEEPEPVPVSPGRVPRISRLMALAIRFEDLVQRGEVENFSELANLGQVTSARMSQIVNMLNLAPDIQEAILFHPLVAGEREAVPERLVRQIASEPDWAVQRGLFRALQEGAKRPS